MRGDTHVRWMVTAWILLAVACGGEPTVEGDTPLRDDPTTTVAVSTTTSGFQGPTDTSPRPFGPAGDLPPPEGYGVLCAGASDDARWYVVLEGPAAGVESVETGVIVPWVSDLPRHNDVDWVLRPDGSPEHLVVAADGAVASVSTANTMHSNLIVAAWSADPRGIEATVDAIARDDDCYAVTAPMAADGLRFAAAMGGTARPDDDSSAYPDHVAFDGTEADLWRGAAHCNWDGTWMLIVESDELPGTGRRGDLHMFVRDPELVGGYGGYEFAGPKDLEREVPEDAGVLATSQSGFELWFSVTEPDYMFVVSPERTEAWVQATVWALCA